MVGLINQYLLDTIDSLASLCSLMRKKDMTVNIKKLVLCVVLVFLSSAGVLADSMKSIGVFEKNERLNRWEKGKKYALVVGISQYEKLPRERQLKYCHKDASLFASCLMEYSRIPFDEVVVLTNEQATRRNILWHFKLMKEKMGPADTFLFFYSGHGVPDDRFDIFLFAHDTDPDLISDDSIELRKLCTRIQSLESLQKIIILDCCYSGAGIESSSPVTWTWKGDGSPGGFSDELMEDLTGKGLVMIVSAQENERSWESESYKQGYFTYNLVEALKGAADQGAGNGDGYVTADEAYNYVYYNVNKDVVNSCGKTQKARMVKSGSGIFFLTQYKEVDDTQNANYLILKAKYELFKRKYERELREREEKIKKLECDKEKAIKLEEELKKRQDEERQRKEEELRQKKARQNRAWLKIHFTGNCPNVANTYVVYANNIELARYHDLYSRRYGVEHTSNRVPINSGTWHVTVWYYIKKKIEVISPGIRFSDYKDVRVIHDFGHVSFNSRDEKTLEITLRKETVQDAVFETYGKEKSQSTTEQQRYMRIRHPGTGKLINVPADQAIQILERLTSKHYGRYRR